MSLIFLDMDGVMNSSQSTHMYWKKNGRKTMLLGFDHICPIAASNLDYLLEKSDAKIVISSAWRHFHSIKEWDQMIPLCPSIEDRIIGVTPQLLRDRLSAPSPPRGHEIYKWLETTGNLDMPYIVLDDSRDMDKVEENFIWVDGDLGLTWKHVMEVFKRWGIDP